MGEGHVEPVGEGVAARRRRRAAPPTLSATTRSAQARASSTARRRAGAAVAARPRRSPSAQTRRERRRSSSSTPSPLRAAIGTTGAPTLGESARVEGEPAAAREVDHVERHDERHAGASSSPTSSRLRDRLDASATTIAAAGELRRRAGERVARDRRLGQVEVQAVEPGQVDDLERSAAAGGSRQQPADAQVGGRAGEVGGLGAQAAEAVEERRLAGVRVAEQEQAARGRRPPPRGRARGRDAQRRRLGRRCGVADVARPGARPRCARGRCGSRAPRRCRGRRWPALPAGSPRSAPSPRAGRLRPPRARGRGGGRRGPTGSPRAQRTRPPGRDCRTVRHAPAPVRCRGLRRGGDRRAVRHSPRICSWLPRDEAVRAADLGEHRGDAGADELDHPPAAPAREVVVRWPGWTCSNRAVAARAGPCAPDPPRPAARGSGRPWRARSCAPPAHRCEHLLGVDMAVLCEDLADESASLGRRPQSAGAQETEELVFFSEADHLFETASQLAARILDGSVQFVKPPAGWSPTGGSTQARPGSGCAPAPSPARAFQRLPLPFWLRVRC